MNDSTTNLEIIRHSPRRFTWGTVTRFHEVGPRYMIVEYERRPVGNETLTEREKVAFHVYVDGRDTSSSTNTLEDALIYAIAFGKLEINEARWMSIAAAKLLGV